MNQFLFPSMHDCSIAKGINYFDGCNSLKLLQFCILLYICESTDKFLAINVVIENKNLFLKNTVWTELGFLLTWSLQSAQGPPKDFWVHR